MRTITRICILVVATLLLSVEAKMQTIELTWPIRNPDITQPYHIEPLEYRGLQLGCCHRAVDLIDLQNIVNAPVYSVASGVVVYAEDLSNDAPDGGWMVKIHHPNLGSGNFYSWYAHLQPHSLTVAAGDQVNRGQKIAHIGCSGFCHGEHLHFVFGNGPNIIGNAVDPIPYFNKQPHQDTTPPTMISAINTPESAIRNLHLEISVSDDNSGVSFVEFKVRTAGGHFITERMTNSNGNWIFNYNTENYQPGTKLEYLFYATDYAGNSAQISGLYRATVVAEDKEAPSIWIVEPKQDQLISGEFSVLAQVEDASAINLVEAHIYFEEDVHGGKVLHKLPLQKQSDNVYRAEFNLTPYTPPAQHNAHILVTARDEHNNIGWSGKTEFPIYINKHNIRIYADTRWHQMEVKWVNYFPMYKGSVISIEASGTAFSGADQQQSVEGDGSVCLENSLIEGACKALIGRFEKAGKSPVYFHVGKSYHWKNNLDGGFLKLAFNDDSFHDNHGYYSAELTILPPHYNTPPTYSLNIKDKANCEPSTCPKAELWVKSNGSYKKVGKWQSSFKWNTRTRSDPEYLFKNLSQIIVVLRNLDTDYTLEWIEANGKQIKTTDFNVEYCLGNGETPFLEINCVPNLSTVNESGAFIFNMN